MPPPSLTWNTLDWRILDRLRAKFLAREASSKGYWTCQEDLAHYDFTYARRIGWKWDAVLRELALRGWQPPPGPVLDWGCGSGIASRRVIEFYGPSHFGELHVADRSRLAVDFASESARAAFPDLAVQRVEGSQVPAFITLVVSHVLNELDETGRKNLRALLDRAKAVLWVEPGTYADSRALIAFREELRTNFAVIAPCTHRRRCGMLNPYNAAHWCHHFASPPDNLLGDADWVRFAHRAGIDLRSLPYSFVVLARLSPGEMAAEGWSRVIGSPRIYKGFAKILDCASDDVREIQVQQRDHAELFRALKKDRSPTLLRVRSGVKDWKIVDETR